MDKMLKELPAWKALILRSIASCVNKDQLKIAWDFIGLFQDRYTAIITPLELYGHSKDLQDAYFRKDCSLTLQQVN